MVTINRQRLLLDHKNFDSNPISKLPILQAFYRLSTCQNHCGGLLVGIPKTIDNDVGITERSIGFDTAVNIATEALDRLHFTAASHNRVIVVEVMGRDAGHIALNAGIAGGAHIILIPEIPYNLENVTRIFMLKSAPKSAWNN